MVNQNEVYIGKGPNYLVIKNRAEPYLHIMPSCTPFDYYNNKTYTCDACDTAQKSFGLQNRTCYACLEMLYASYGDQFSRKLHE